jgi:hypothetical protein
MTAHHDLTGWDDFDDHLMYHTDARGDARYLKLDGTSPAMTGPIVTTGPNIDITSPSAIERYFRAYGSSGGVSYGTDAAGNLLIGLLDSAGNILKPIISGEKLGPARMFWDGAERITTAPGGAITTQSHSATQDIIAGQWSRAKYGLSLVNSDLGITDPDVRGDFITLQSFDQNAVGIVAKNATAPAVVLQVDDGVNPIKTSFLNTLGSFVTDRAITREPLQQVAAATPGVIAAMLSAGIDPNDVSLQQYLDPAEPAVDVWDLGLLLGQMLIRIDSLPAITARIAANGDVLSFSGLIPPVVNHIAAGEYEITVPFSAASMDDLVPLATPQVTTIGNKPFTAQADSLSVDTILVSTGDNNATGTDAAFSINVAAVVS